MSKDKREDDAKKRVSTQAGVDAARQQGRVGGRRPNGPLENVSSNAPFLRRPGDDRRSHNRVLMYLTL